MQIVYERTRNTTTGTTVVNNETVETSRQYADVAMIGVITGINKKNTRDGKKMVIISLKTNETRVDETLGVEVEVPVNVMFIDNPDRFARNDENPRPGSATRVEKMKPSKGSQVLIKASRCETTTLSTGDKDVAYFGSDMYYTGSRAVYKVSDYGPGAYILFGNALRDQQNTNLCSVSVNIWNNNTKERQTVWAHLTELCGNNDRVSEDTAKEIYTPIREGSKCNQVCFVIPKSKYREDVSDQGVITGINGVFSAYYVSEPRIFANA
jgi:hypothetical protein